jgi:oxaloacetate decarboxylase gamma subunit
MALSIGELAISGLQLMVLGMGIVFLFLALLVGVIGWTSTLIQRFSPEEPNQTLNPTLVHAVGGSDDVDAELLVAISAAIHHHQNKQN